MILSIIFSVLIFFLEEQNCSILYSVKIKGNNKPFFKAYRDHFMVYTAMVLDGDTCCVNVDCIFHQMKWGDYRMALLIPQPQLLPISNSSSNKDSETCPVETSG